jgi:hypothetical protein
MRAAYERKKFLSSIGHMFLSKTKEDLQHNKDVLTTLSNSMQQSDSSAYHAIT